MKKLLFSFFIVFAVFNGYAQTKADIFGNAPITWLGLDFTQLKFIGNATQFKDAGEISNRDMRVKFFPAWNNLFISEQKKFNVADAVDRNSVEYATEVTQNANDNSNNDYFTQKPGEYQLLTADMISTLVSKYDFKGKTGIGMLFFVEGMSKDKEEASMWVTFVNMGAKNVLLTKRATGGAGGFGFRNFWAKSFYNVLKDMDLKKWK